MKMDSVKLEIKEDALKEIAKLAVSQNTGARGLRSIIEDSLMDLMYKVPDQKDLYKVVINKDVCEGCGDCSVQSNCVSIEPLETELGRKRKINQINKQKTINNSDKLERKNY